MSYDVMQVCLNGHQITTSYKRYPEFRKEFCDKCGEKTITSCPKCNANIRGEYYVVGVIAVRGRTPVPEYCHECGAPYPWTEKSKKEITQKETANPLLIVERICSRFHLVARQLKDRYDNRLTFDIADEYDVQDLLHALLKIHFDDIRTEEWTPSYAGGSSRMDLLLKKEKIVVEVKMARISLGERELGNQLLEDIGRYQKHPDCKVLFCFVYDPEGIISNPRGLEEDLSKVTKEFTVEVRIAP